MGNSPVDKSEDFIKSGMTLITEVNSDKYIKRSVEMVMPDINGQASVKLDIDQK